MSLSRQCVILVGGLGSRLGHLTRNNPKPLLEVGGQPFLEHLLRNVRRFGFDDVILLAGYCAERIIDFADRASKTLAISIRVVVEPEPAGTAGALYHAKDLLEEEFLMMNGDSFFDFNILDLASRNVPGEWLARIALRRVQDAGRYGFIDVEGCHIRDFREKGEPTEGVINGGVYWMRRGIVECITGVPCSLEKDVFPALAARTYLCGFCYAGPFIDIGVPEDLAYARANWTHIRRRPATFFDRDGVLNYDDGYTHRVEDFRWIDGAREAIKRCNDAGRYVFVVTNQAGIARGYYNEQDVRRLHSWMNEDLRASGAHIDDFRYCPHHPDGKIPGYAKVCDCRKPAPGMIESILREWPVDRQASFLIGDKPSDLEAAKRACIRAILVGPNVLRDVESALNGCDELELFDGCA
jgi:D,D-heptose 1,7-bisphosphate phosphatase